MNEEHNETYMIIKNEKYYFAQVSFTSFKFNEKLRINKIINAISFYIRFNKYI